MTHLTREQRVADKQKILLELSKAKAIFQQRAILAVLGVTDKPTNERKE